MTRTLNGGMTSIAGICAVIVALAAIDTRVRDQVSALASGRGPSGEFLTITERLKDFAFAVLQAGLAVEAVVISLRNMGFFRLDP